MEKKYNWIKIADQEKDIIFQQNNLTVVKANEKMLSLGKHQNKLFAFAHLCPHAGGIMTDGWIDARGNVVCPVHGYRFSMINGRNTTGEGYFLKHWPVEQRKDGIYVGIENELMESSL